MKFLADLNAWRKATWDAHGSKILGFATAFIGGLEYVDAKTLDAINYVFGDHYGPIISHGIIVGAGICTARRGWTNSAKAAA